MRTREEAFKELGVRGTFLDNQKLDLPDFGPRGFKGFEVVEHKTEAALKLEAVAPQMAELLFRMLKGIYVVEGNEVEEVLKFAGVLNA